MKARSEELRIRPEQKKLELVIGDFVKADLPYFDVCISNTPYQVSTSLSHPPIYHRGRSG